MPEPTPVPDAAEDPDPFVVLTITRTPGSAASLASARTFWSEMEAHRAAEAAVIPGRRVWLLTPDTPELDQMEYGRD